ncbi:PQQ-binding-like beta-propeller repeat protein [Pseudenhygromyxa sp. WMMC2535]|uniref:outer membrane protein assembly factor BamB family protein n=1 Tax=Pseudenhygromyxa sp. WMMC2535 TaxID=2712867 RepID=UPI001595501E|nr:PQQ-binding-like beta-propeller repeat protein [Pseudenhygromyxa sp. WMMC2535]NVB41527.1 PQQ-binding-like beta-propeller repeat protein [Pseudenhygromyxa sp. WMMC2535]
MSRASERGHGLLGLGLSLAVAASILGVGCGLGSSGGKTIVLHPEESDAARALWNVDFTVEFTIPENFRYRTEEYGSAAADPARGLIYVGSRDGTLLAIDDVHGEFVWELDLGGGLSSPPVLAVVEEGADESGHLHAHVALPGDRPDWMLVGTDDGALVALDLETREVRWRYRTSGLVRTPAVLGEAVVHFANSRDEIITVDVRSGDWVWQYSGEFQKDFTVFGRAGLAYLPPVEAAAGDVGQLFTGFADGRVVALDATSGEARWVQPLAPPDAKLFVDVDTTPVLVPERGELIVANQTSGVYSLDLSDGARRWNTEIRAVGSIVEGPGIYLAASSLEGLYGLEQDGRIRWREQLDPGAIAAPLVIGDTVLVAHSDAGLLAYSADSGEMLLRFFNGSGSSGQPIYDPVLERVYASSDRGVLYALGLLPE